MHVYMCMLTIGVGYIVVLLVEEHGSCQVRVLGETSDLESDLEKTRDVGMYSLTPFSDMEKCACVF